MNTATVLPGASSWQEEKEESPRNLASPVSVFQGMWRLAETRDEPGAAGWLEITGSTEATRRNIEAYLRRAERIHSYSPSSEVTGDSFTDDPGCVVNDRLAADIRQVFERAVDEHFEDGMESAFSRDLTRIVRCESDAVDYLINLIVGGQVNDELASEALRWMGHMGDHYPSYEGRRWLLEKCLFSSSPRIRDGAVLGLSFLEDPHAIDFLRQAMEREPNPALAEDMEEVISSLSLS